MQASARFFLFALLLGSCSGDVTDQPIQPQAVRVTAARQGPVVEGRRYLADVAPEESVKVLAQVPGTISALPVDEGTAAADGTVLVRLAAPDMVAKLSRVRSERQRAERERDFACSRFETDQVLGEAGDLAPEQLRASDKNCASASLAVSAAQAAEQEVTVVTARASERAPFDGVVLDHLVDVGQTVGPGAPMLLFGSTQRELVVRLAATDIADGVGVGTEVVFDGGRGRIDRVGGQVTGPGRVVDAHIAVDEGLDALPMTGGSLSVRLVTDQRTDAISVPLDAVGGLQKDEHFVLVEEDERVSRVDVRPGPQQDGWIAVEPVGDGGELLARGSRVVRGQPDAVSTDRPVLAIEVRQ